MPKHITCRAALHNLDALLPWYAVRQRPYTLACNHEFTLVIPRHA